MDTHHTFGSPSPAITNSVSPGSWRTVATINNYLCAFVIALKPNMHTIRSDEAYCVLRILSPGIPVAVARTDSCLTHANG